jgi:hypothetical protein
MKVAGVHVVRLGIETDDKTVDLVQRIYAHGIRVSAISPMTLSK